jgi:hypothetical protein
MWKLIAWIKVDELRSTMIVDGGESYEVIQRHALWGSSPKEFFPKAHFRDAAEFINSLNLFDRAALRYSPPNTSNGPHLGNIFFKAGPISA